MNFTIRKLLLPFLLAGIVTTSNSCIAVPYIYRGITLVGAVAARTTIIEFIEHSIDILFERLFGEPSNDIVIVIIDAKGLEGRKKGTTNTWLPRRGMAKPRGKSFAFPPS